MFSVWFECKTCRGSFLELCHFLEHKKQDHFDEFQNTECIIFEERRIPNNEQMTVSFSPTPQEIGETNSHEFIDLQTMKLENENLDECINPEFQSHTEDQTLNFFEPDTISSKQDFENKADDFILSKKKASATHSVNTSSISENSTATNGTCLGKDSDENSKTILDLENKADAAINVNADALNSSDLEPTQLFIETQPNPFVLLKRINRQEIQRCSGIGSKRTRSVKQTKKTDSFHSILKRSDKNLNNLFICKLCLDKFNTDLELTTHTNSCFLSHSNRTPFYCAPCNKTFSISESLKKHVIRNHPDEQKTVKSKKLKKCHLCSRKFLYEYELKRHTLTHSRNKQMQKPSTRPFKNQRCEASIIKKYKLSQHSMRLKKTENRSSEQRIKNNDNDRLQQTISAGSGSQKFNCDHPRCEKSFPSKHQREIHMATNLTARPFKCPQPKCDKTFKRKDHVRYHTINVHSDSGLGKHSQVNLEKRITKKDSCPKLVPTDSNREVFKCPISSCPQTFKRRGSIRLHMLLHSGLRQFKCTQVDCGKTFQLKHHLQNHLTTHSDTKPFKCHKTSCEKTVKTSLGFHNHMEVHSDSGIQLIKCSEMGCKKVFKSKSGLREHLLTHHYLKPSKCSEIETDDDIIANAQGTKPAIKIYSGPFKCTHPNCGKLYPMKCRLKRHEATHLDARPFKCTELSCLKAFKEKKHLLMHVKMHSGERPFKCPVPTCDYSCIQKNNLKIHLLGKKHKHVQDLLTD